MTSTTMSDTALGARGRRRLGLRVADLPRPRPELAALLILAAVLDLWALSRNGWANTYYSAAVRSMSTSWHDFLYGSFDVAGVQTVDKPPLALWVQALSVRAFGFGSWSILVPQALMGVATVGLAYDLVRRRFGRAAGFAGGLALATTPIAVAISRHNNPDALLALCSTGAVWCIVRGLEDGRTRWVALAGMCVGLGFEAKMGAALLVVPAIAAAYLWVAPRGRLAALRSLGLGGAVMAVVGLAWPVLVWLTPAASRPYVSGTSDNSIWSLIFGYNGLGRLDGQAGGPGGMAGGPGGGGGGGPFGGGTGAFRLLNDSLGGQAGWLLGFAVVAGVALLASSRLRRGDAHTGWLIAVGGAFATSAVAFSSAKGIFHPYYVSAMAPFTAALIGGGVGRMLQRDRLARIAAPAALVAGAVTELVVLHDNPDSLVWLGGVLGALIAVAAVGLALAPAGRLRGAVLAAGLGLLLIAPSTWAFQTLGHATSSTFPAGGPASAGGGFGGPGGGGPGGGGFMARGGGPPAGFAPGGATGAPQTGGQPPAGGFGGGGPFGGDANISAIVAYVKAHGGGTIAVSSQQGAAQQIIATGAKVAGIGGFSGRESDISATWLAQAVRDGRIRWVVADSSGGMGQDGRTGATQAMAAVAKACTPVSSSSSTTSSSSTALASLYDCSGKADAIASAAG